MKTNQYLYGLDVEIPAIPEYVIMRRIEALKDNLSTLLEINYKERDFRRVEDVVKAIDFWYKLEVENS